MRRSGYTSPLFLIAVRTRSRASLTAPVGNPTRKKFGSPCESDVYLDFDEPTFEPHHGRGRNTRQYRRRTYALGRHVTPKMRHGRCHNCVRVLYMVSAPKRSSPNFVQLVRARQAAARLL
jgi:hypothetical protein